MKIVFTDANIVYLSYPDAKPIEALGDVTIYRETEYKDIAKRIKDADAVLCNKTPLNEETLKYANNLKYIGVFATGYDNVDIDYCKKRGITVTNAGKYSTDAVCQHVFAFILFCMNKIKEYSDYVRNDKWKDIEHSDQFMYPTFELKDKTIGIIGYGSIGKAVKDVAKAFKMNVLVYTRTPSVDNDVTFSDLETLLKKSDIITVHCPLNDKTKKMFNDETFTIMKDNTIFINTSRGGLVDETALEKALKNKLSYACLDVLENEPMDINSKLNKYDNCIITPHAAWATTEARKRLMDILCENLKNFEKGNPTNVVTI